MSHLFRATHDNARDVLLTLTASAYILGFLVAVELALAKLSF